MSTCSYCYQRGHNKRGCPSLKEDAARDKEQGLDTWRTRYVEAQAKSAKTRRCSYCGQPGHTRRTCTLLESATVVYINQAKQLHKSFARVMARVGAAPGALVRSGYEVYDYRTRESIEHPLCMITKIYWEKLTPVNMRGNFIVAQTVQKYQRSTWATDPENVILWNCFTNSQYEDTATMDLIRSMGGGYHYPKHSKDMFEMVSPMHSTIDLSGVNYKRMAENHFRDHDAGTAGDPASRQAVVDYWCEIIERM
jgi:hypothetical protein